MGTYWTVDLKITGQIKSDFDENGTVEVDAELKARRLEAEIRKLAEKYDVTVYGKVRFL
jgi:hypothetical protein